MRILIVTEFMTLDGNIGAPMWSAEYWGDDIAAFKGAETEGGDTILLGSGTLARSLLRAGLVDRLHLLVYPLTVGEGPRLFDDGMASRFKLVESKQMASGAVALVYEKDE